jgi:hypothetical protein
MGFVTGMILALVGAVFILGKLRESSSEFEAQTDVMVLSLKSASPGIILAALGVGLMLTTIVTHHEISVTDVPVYVTGAGLVPARAGQSDKPPLDLPDRDSSELPTDRKSNKLLSR